MAKKFWWQNQPLTISALQCDVKSGSERAFDEYVSQNYFNTEQLLHLNADGYIVFYEDEIHGERLDKYLKKTREKGIRVIVYTNDHAMDNNFSNKYPDFAQRKKDGEPIIAYNVFTMPCINVNGGFHKKLIENVKKLCTHDIDGIFLDGPVMQPAGCYCERCQKDFIDTYGHTIFEGSDYERQNLRIKTLTAHIKEVNKAVKSINPNIALYLNNSALRPDVTGSNTRELYNYVDILGAEGGFHKPLLDNEMLWQTSAFLKHLECIIGDPLKEQKPMVNFFAGNESGLPISVHTPMETTLTYAHSLAGGGNIWYGLHADLYEVIESESIATAKAMNKFILDNKELFSATKTCARVAVMWSQETANNYSSSVAESDFTQATKTGYKERGDHRIALLSVVDILERAHIQFDLIDEHNIKNGYLDNYQALILPTVACLSNETASAIKKFVYSGGNVLGNFDVALYNENGTFANKCKLDDVFGFVGVPKVFPAKYAYMYKQTNHPLTDGFYIDAVTVPSLECEWEIASDVNVLAKSSRSKTGVYSKPAKGEKYPSVLEHKYGKGTAYYISGNFLEDYDKRKIVQYAKMVSAFCNISADKVVTTDGKGLYEVVLRKQEDKFILHVVNMTGAMERPIQDIVPLCNVNFTVNLKGFGIDKDSYEVSSVRGANLKNVSVKPNEVSFTLDKIDAYEIITIK